MAVSNGRAFKIGGVYALNLPESLIVFRAEAQL